MNFIFLLNITFSSQLGGKLYNQFYLEVKANGCRFFTTLITPKYIEVIVVYGWLVP
jgi:hypothetical protein